ncbi:cupin domain-containing protein [Hymenobacter jejuensis]|uniref:Cupin domain-containing protein n=1 Tax=Hymenobacter jejuensis TaxID=2502781 RepID=A0A5B8A080_9BACT|nr:cupin domain-containing protein [Hymenobacter jejuensis]QDA60469.1 cupin domain-containing protein [Hymenobacter jejuensis]
MQRRQFVFSALAAVPFITTAQAGLPSPSKGFVAKAGEGRFHGHIQLKGVNSNILDVKVSGKDTGGLLAIFEQTSVSPKRGTPLHLHHFQDEVFFVQTGEYYFQVGDDKYRLHAGDSIFLPRKVPHAWTQVSDTGKMTVTLQPAGKLEGFFMAMAALKATPTNEEIAKIFAAHEMQVVGPPLAVD